MEVFTTLTDTIVNTVLAPLLLITGSTVLVVAKSYADKITKSIVSRNEADALHSVTESKVNLLEEIDMVVDAAVASNMQFAEELKSRTGKLTSEDVKQLNKAARQVIYDSLSPTLVGGNGALSQMIGGADRLDSIIESLIEKHVIEQKVEMKSLKG